MDERNWPAMPGVYALILEAIAPVVVTVGALGLCTLPPGHYAYVGSAAGPGGLAARLRRHLAAEKRLHWHIDYLTARLPIVAVCMVAGPERRECAWVRQFLALAGASVPIPRFGSGDCAEHCPAHLIALPAWLPADSDLLGPVSDRATTGCIEGSSHELHELSRILMPFRVNL